MFLFHLYINFSYSEFKCIYIPLCFYFITFFSCYLIIQNIHLHSTMFLFHLILTDDGQSIQCQFTFHYVSISSDCQEIRLWQTHVIYIPLCFYFIRLTLKSNKLKTIIYIPLCFYFIVTRDLQTTANEIIYIPLCFYFIDGSTSYEAIAVVNLHSTMFLFHLNLVFTALHYIYIYIPLCFYFIQEQWTTDNAPTGFTFHYVSISS